MSEALVAAVRGLRVAEPDLRRLQAAARHKLREQQPEACRKRRCAQAL
jgi:hypothetical protein